MPGFLRSPVSPHGPALFPPRPAVLADLEKQNKAAVLLTRGQPGGRACCSPQGLGLSSYTDFNNLKLTEKSSRLFVSVRGLRSPRVVTGTC